MNKLLALTLMTAFLASPVVARAQARALLFVQQQPPLHMTQLGVLSWGIINGRS